MKEDMENEEEEVEILEEKPKPETAQEMFEDPDFVA